MGDKSAHLRRAPVPDAPPAGRLSIGERLPHFKVHLGQARHAESRRGSASGRVLVKPSPLRSNKGAGMGQEPPPNELAPSKPVRPSHVPRKQFCRNINVFAALPHQQSRLGKQPCLRRSASDFRIGASAKRSSSRSPACDTSRRSVDFPIAGSLKFSSKTTSPARRLTRRRVTAQSSVRSLQHGADIETIRKALCRDSHGRASGPLGAGLDRLAGGSR
jgi:hypothetical protein